MQKLSAHTAVIMYYDYFKRLMCVATFSSLKIIFGCIQNLNMI